MRKRVSVAAMSAASLVSLAGGQVTIDSFNSGIPLPLWIPSDPAGDGISVMEANSRLEFPFTVSNTAAAVAGFAGNAWGIATSGDFKARITMRFAPSNPTHLYGALNLNLSLIGRPKLANGFYEGSYAGFGSFTEGTAKRLFAVGRVNANSTTTGVALFIANLGQILFFNVQSGQPAFSASDTATLFVRYVTVTDTLYYSLVGYDDPQATAVAAATNLQRRPLQVFLGAKAQQPRAQSGSDAWMDEFILDLGAIVYSKQPTLLWQHPVTGDFGFWNVNPSGTVTSPGSFAALDPASGWQQYGIGDFNADGLVDIFWRNNITGTNYVWYLAGVNLFGGAVPPGVPVGLGWTPVGVGDLNRDAYADIIWKNETTGIYQIWLMQEGTIIGGGTLGAPGDEWRLAACGDINKDGRDDLIWRRESNGNNYVWYMNGMNYLGGANLPSLSANLGWTLQGAIDVNRDGQDDLVWRHQVSGQSIVWIMNGTALGSTLSLPVTYAPWKIVGSQ